MWPSQQITSLYKQREFWQILVSYFISQCFVIIWSGSEMYGKYAAGRSLIRNMSPESESRPHDLYLWVLTCLAPGQTASELHIRKEGNVLLSVSQWEGAGWGHAQLGSVPGTATVPCLLWLESPMKRDPRIQTTVLLNQIQRPRIADM